MKEPTTTSELLGYRIYLAFTVFAPGYIFLFKLAVPGAVTLLPAYYLASVLAIGLLVLSFLSSYVRQRMELVMNGVFYFIVSLAVLTNYLNGGNIYYSLANILNIMIVIPFFKTSRLLVVFTLITVAFSLGGHLFLENPPFNKSLFTIFLITASLSPLYISLARFKTQEQLAKSRQSLAVIFEQSTDALLLIDVNTRKILDCNNAAVSLFGFDNKSEIQSLKSEIDLFTSGFTAKEADEFMDEIMAKGEVINKVYYVQVKNGSSFWGSFAGKLIQLGDKNVLLGRIGDISQIKNAEIKVQEKTAQLEKLNSLMVGREIEMRNLKEKIERLEGPKA